MSEHRRLDLLLKETRRLRADMDHLLTNKDRQTPDRFLALADEMDALVQASLDSPVLRALNPDLERQMAELRAAATSLRELGQSA